MHVVLTISGWFIVLLTRSGSLQATLIIYDFHVLANHCFTHTAFSAGSVRSDGHGNSLASQSGPQAVKQNAAAIEYIPSDVRHNGDQRAEHGGGDVRTTGELGFQWIAGMNGIRMGS